MDFACLGMIGWLWYCLGSILNDFSRFIIAWKLLTTMAATDAKELLDRAVEKTGIHEIPVRHWLRLLSDRGSAHVSGKLKVYLASKGMTQTHGVPSQLMTWRRIELHHRSMKDENSLWKHYPVN